MNLRRILSGLSIIPDSRYLMCFGMFARAKEKGCEKFTDMALNFCSLLQSVISDTDDSTIVYVLRRAGTLGKLLKEKLAAEGLFSIVPLCTADESGRHFVTQTRAGRTRRKRP